MVDIVVMTASMAKRKVEEVQIGIVHTCNIEMTLEFYQGLCTVQGPYSPVGFQLTSVSILFNPDSNPPLEVG